MEKATRHSPKREAILSCIRSTDAHPSADWVYAMLKPQIPDLSLATVYRNLAKFRQDGVIRVIGSVDGQERYDGDIAPHSHFICRGCGKVADLPAVEVAMPDMESVGRSDNCSVTFYGCCNECLEKTSKN